MCICVDCHWVDRCQAYHAVERQHGVAHLNAAPDMVPRQPRIHVQVIDLGEAAVGVEWDVRACEDFRCEPGRWQRLRPDLAVPS
jgi:hypothetical protein